MVSSCPKGGVQFVKKGVFITDEFWMKNLEYFGVKKYTFLIQIISVLACFLNI